MPASDSLGFKAWRGMPSLQPNEHAHGDLELNLPFTGAVTYFHGGRFATIPTGHLAVMWAAIPHQLTAVEDGTRMAWVTVPLAMALRWGLSEQAVARLMRGELLLSPSADAVDAALAEGWAVDFEQGGDPATVQLEVQARLRRLLSAAEEAPAEDASGVISRMAAWLAEHRAEDVAMEDLARAVGLHPKYAATRFREVCGMTPWQYLTRLRVAEAQRLMLTTAHTVLAVAQQAGFGSQARFYAAFKDVCGEAPGRWRKRHRR